MMFFLAKLFTFDADEFPVLVQRVGLILDDLH